IETEIVCLQRSTAETLALRAGQRWSEQGETSIQYSKGCIRQSQSIERISALREHPGMGPSSEPSFMSRSASAFYRQLYTPDSVSELQIEAYLDEVGSMPRLSNSDHAALLEPISLEEILVVTRKVVSKQSSSGQMNLDMRFSITSFAFLLFRT
ncbi:hypothetical protein EDC96DRAFT_451584, partial [Choanephora cucurbitarum]